MTSPNNGFLLFEANGAPGFGVLRDHGIVDLSRRRANAWPNLRSVIEARAWREALDFAATAETDYAESEVTFLPPLPSEPRILCVGVNYPDRAQEYGDSKAPAYPSLFVRFPSSLVGHEQPLQRPTASHQFDYEGEIAIVIGKGGRHVSQGDALGHIAALTLCNEGSVRDWMRHGNFNVTQGKNFDRSGALGPCLVPFEREDQLADVRLTTRVNGEIRQDDRTSRMLFPFRRIIEYVSTFMALRPGDIIVTGTPTGAGARRDPPVWLQPGDIVEVSAEGIGVLSNGIADEPS